MWHPVAGRWMIPISFDEETEAKILQLARETFGDQTLLRGGFNIGRYQMQDGITPQLWKHFDQSACQFSLDICLDKTIDWQLVVEDVEFNEQPNDCVVFCGNYNMHWRTPYPTGATEDDYVTLMFMQFAKPDHWLFTEGAHGFDNHGHEGDYIFRERMGYWSTPDYSDGRPICSCCDYRNIMNAEEDYQKLKSEGKIFWPPEARNIYL
jgi:hypothetical protein